MPVGLQELHQAVQVRKSCLVLREPSQRLHESQPATPLPPRRVKYYNNCLFHNVQRNFIMQSGDPTATGKGGSSIYG